MTGRAACLLGWLCLGHALAAGLYVLLINVPDANIPVLLASLLLAVALVFIAGVTNVTAVVSLAQNRPLRGALWTGVRRGLPAAILALLVYAAVRFLTGAGYDWYRAHAGQVDAWWMATFDSTRTAWLHRAIAAFLFVLRDVVGLSLGVAVLCAVALGGWRGAGTTAWIGAAFSRRQLGIVAVAVILFAALPWRAIGWRPAQLPSTWLEPAFVGVKLVVAYVLANLGWGLVLTVGARRQ
jgi:hypothetical protein